MEMAGKVASKASKISMSGIKGITGKTKMLTGTTMEGLQMTFDATTKVSAAATGAVGKVGLGGLNMTLDATKAAVGVGKGGLALTMDATKKLAKTGIGAVAAGVSVAGATVATVKTGLHITQTKPMEAAGSTGHAWTQLIDESDVTLAMTAAEREDRKRYVIPEDEWEACTQWLWFPVSTTRQAWDF